jgi:hypothetical protein
LNPSAVPDFCWPYLEPEGEFITLAEEKTGLLKSEFRSIGKHSLGVPELVALSATYYYYLIDVSFLALATPADVLFGRENKTCLAEKIRRCPGWDPERCLTDPAATSAVT